MMKLDELRKKAVKIQKLRTKRESIFIDHQQIIEKKETALIKLCKDYLLEYDETYQSYIQTNYGLLQDDKIEFKVLEVETSLFPSHTHSFSTELTESGILKYESKLILPTIDFLNADRYPKNYKGLITAFGETSLKVNEVKFGYGSYTLPKKLVGEIDDQGNLFVRIVEYGFDFVFLPLPGRGKKYINRLQANLFSGDRKKSKDFFDNVEILNNLAQEFRNSLI